MSVAEIAQGIAANLEAIPETQILPCVISTPTPPTIWVATMAPNYDMAFGARTTGHTYTDEYTATIQCLVQLSDEVGANSVIYQYLSSSGAYSVKAAIEADKRLGGASDDLWVENGALVGLTTFLTSAYLLAEWSVTIISTEVAL